MGIAGHRMVAGVVDGDDGGVVQGRDGLRLTLEPGLELRVPGKVGTQQFDGNGPSQACIDATVDVGHASAAYELPELIAPVEDTLCRHRDAVLPVRRSSWRRGHGLPLGWNGAGRGPWRGNQGGGGEVVSHHRTGL